jgi:hypothetical protein
METAVPRDCLTAYLGKKITTSFLHVSARDPSLPFRIAGSKALDLVESFLFVEPAICLSASESSTLVAPAIFFTKDWPYFRHPLPLTSKIFLRKGSIEHIHAGRGHTFSLDHRRFTDRQAQSVIRHTAESLNPFVTDFPLWDKRLTRLPP